MPSIFLIVEHSFAMGQIVAATKFGGCVINFTCTFSWWISRWYLVRDHSFQWWIENFFHRHCGVCVFFTTKCVRFLQNGFLGYVWRVVIRCRSFPRCYCHRRVIICINFVGLFWVFFSWVILMKLSSFREARFRFWSCVYKKYQVSEVFKIVLFNFS